MKQLKYSTILVLLFSTVSFAFISNAYSASLLSGIVVLEKKGEVIVHEVKPKTPIVRSGIRKDDIIVEIEGVKIKRMDDYVMISKKLKNVKLKVEMLIKRQKNIIKVLIEDYSIPIKQFWGIKVPYSMDKTPGKESPFNYWYLQAKRKLDNIKHEKSPIVIADAYHNAISNMYSALHYDPKKVMALVLIADTYKKMGEVLLNAGSADKAKTNFLNSVVLYKKSLSKIELPKKDLIKIRDNLNDIEKLLRP